MDRKPSFFTFSKIGCGQEMVHHFLFTSGVSPGCVKVLYSEQSVCNQMKSNFFFQIDLLKKKKRILVETGFSSLKHSQFIVDILPK